MTFKEFLEIIAALLTIIVSAIFLYGALMGVRKKIFRRIHDIITAIEDKLNIKSQ